MARRTSITRCWAKRGTRPSAPRDQRTDGQYVFDALPDAGQGRSPDPTGLQYRGDEPASDPRCAKTVASDAHAVLLVDQAGWHMSTGLVVPPNITMMALPPKCPELNPVENVWQFMRDNWLSNRVFKSYDDLVDHCCAAWNNLVDQPWRIMSIGLHQWAHGF